MKFKLLLFFTLLPSCLIFSQTPYGNDWINFSQTYYKIKISKDGVYRITQNQLQQAGLPVSEINPKNIQLFSKGQQIALFISGEGDAQLDVGDYLEFYASKNDGKLDKPLYADPANQPHDYYSLYTDTAAYFLTWSNSVPGKRFTGFTGISTGLTAESYFMHTEVSFFTDGGYYPGAYILAETSLSEYTAGEGILGSTIHHASSQIKALSTPFLFSGAASIDVEAYVAGRSNSQTGNTNNHHLRIEVSKDGSNFVTKRDILYREYNVVRDKFNLGANELGGTTYFRFSAVKDLAASSTYANYTDYQAPGYLKIQYPRQYNLQGQQFLKFTLKGFQTENTSLIRFSNSSLITPIVLDLTNNIRIEANQSNGILEAIVPGAGNDKEIFVYDHSNFGTPEITPVNFVNFSPSNSDKNFLIVTHTSLLAKAQEYADYRAQTGYKPLVVTTDQLYNQFYYGIHHPLAIRHFCKYLIEKAARKPEYLLLLGKGKSHFFLRNEFEKDLVPGIGNPPSDNMLTSGLDGTVWEPAISTGRVAAQTPAEVEIYLNKLKTYEQQPDSIWRKNFIHVSGGNTVYENTQWSGFQNSFLREAAKESFGAKAINFQKNVSEPITDNLKNKIVASINKGAGLLSFFGHGSAQATEVNFGEPEELQNQNKLLVYMINGCNAGNPFTQISLGEKMIFQPWKAAIGWLATSDEGVASYLGNFSTILYRNLFKNNYGKSIAENLKATIKSYQNSSDILNRTHSRQYLWQGDPALKFYSPTKPDYYLENKDLFIYPENITAASDSFAVAIITKNLGKALNSPLSVSVKHTLPDNTILTYPARTFDPVYNTDTLFFYIKRENLKLGGSNKFTISLDANNSFDELNEVNNTASFNFIMPSNGVTILSPLVNSIISNPSVELKAQASNLFSNDIEFNFEIDTIRSFNSGWKKSSGNVTQNNIATWQPGISLENHKVYYWRVKLAGSEDSWQDASFTYIEQSPNGWNQSHKNQFEDLSFKGTHWISDHGRVAFNNTTFITNIQTLGDDVTSGEERAYRSDPGGRLGFGDTNFTGVSIIALNPSTLTTFTYTSAFNIPGEFVNSGEFHFNINNSIEVDSLIRYINNIPANYYVVGHNGRNISLKDLSAQAKTALQSVGLSTFQSVGPGEPYMFWGQKGSAPGTAIEITADPNSSTPARRQVIKFQKEYYYPFTQGSYASELVGPSKKWESLQYEFEADAYDELSLNIIGVKENGVESNLIQRSSVSESVDLSDIDANEYPFLKFNVSLADKTNRTPAQLKSWKVLYDGYPEGSINTSLKNNFYTPVIQEGDTVKWELAYQNISSIKTDSITTFYTLTKSDRSATTTYIDTFAPLNPGDSTSVTVKIPTKGLKGSNTLKIEFKPKDDKDRQQSNNYLNQFFTVINDNRAPLVNVLFDGKNIINSELVSPKPVINISVLDDSKYFKIADTSSVEISHKKQEESDSEYKREYFSSSKLSFTPSTSTVNNKAVIEYRPDRFEDGTYTLKVRGKDALGNYNETTDYQIDFEVVNESSISNFYPYPNPFTTSMKFVFTLTGDKIPDKLKIQILTATGKIVREVLKEELGDLRIGNNISQFTWNGTDQFGDRLANGVYFYRVLVENNDSTAIKHRSTAGDKFFKNNFGKIYLMR
ncbi:C25 family cysteine peptidase [Desertivirga xinjiangensis]|uniref:putative type IX secretion system sortase PorU2 n=1 Tax=Desertivirga xinjiangensis TaxID=539206 RepID=UPI002109348C|nr:C25 family cysteine peptidase [Pedobacter xinjiangensis]